MNKEHAEQPDVPSKLTKLINRMLYVSIAVIAIGVALFLYWSFQSEKIIQVNNEPFPVRSVRENAEANGVIILNVDYCKFYNTEGELRVSFINTDHEVFLPLTKERSPKGCRDTEFPLLIPAVIEPGKYKVKFRVFYDLNPLKRGIQNEFISQEFEISPSLTKQP